MNKLTPFIFLLALLAGCRPKAPQNLYNREVTSFEGELILVGLVNREGLLQAPYRTLFEEYYNDYEVDQAALDPVKEKLQGVEVLLFMGTWCSDSQMQVPQFYKILDEMGYDTQQLTVVGLDNHPDRYKTSPGGEEKGWDINAVPTFIFLRDGAELGRIVEYPEQTLEKDMARILEE